MDTCACLVTKDSSLLIYTVQLHVTVKIKLVSVYEFFDVFHTSKLNVTVYTTLYSMYNVHVYIFFSINFKNCNFIFRFSGKLHQTM